VRIASACFRPAGGAPLDAQPGRRRIDGEVEFEHDLSLPGAVYLFRAPRSLTRQDCVEIHTVSSPPLIEMLLARLHELGARQALPGEFTARAYLGGALNLEQAEAVAALVDARTDAQLEAARRMMSGDLTRRISGAQDALAELAALVEADIDFSEEAIEFIAPDELCARLSALADELAGLLRDAGDSRPTSVLPRVMLVGPPNAGKSSLLNALSGLDRAICSAVAGTTRDVISASIRIGRSEAILLDAAGIDETDDPLLVEAQSLALAAARNVDLLCVVVDASKPDAAGQAESIRALLRGQLARVPRVIVGNKSDLLPAGASTGGASLMGLHDEAVPPVWVSAVRGDGLDELRGRIADALGTASITGEAALALSVRQRQAVSGAVGAIQRAMQHAGHAHETVDQADVIAVELREALDALGEVCGAVTTDDLLGQVFANFCIGK